MAGRREARVAIAQRVPVNDTTSPHASPSGCGGADTEYWFSPSAEMTLRNVVLTRVRMSFEDLGVPK